MKTIICGSGDVGYSIADKLSKENSDLFGVEHVSENNNNPD